MPEYGEPLTDREKELLQMVATGVTNRQVAQRLTISVNTVKVHLRNIYAKLGAESRTEATMIAIREGWVSVESPGEALTPGGEGPSTKLQASPAPPLPRFKRVALVAAALLAVTGMALTWPRSGPQLENGPSLPFDQSPEDPVTARGEGTESAWHERAQMPTRRAHLALAVAEGQILAIAGRTPEGVTGAVEAYDPESDTWTTETSKPTPAAYVAAALVGGDIYVPGGCDAGGLPVRAVEVYDVQSDEWRQVRPLPEPRCAYALGAVDGQIFLFGGWDGERYVADAYVYDVQTDMWRAVPPMSGERGFAAAAAIASRVFVVGGYDGDRELTTCAIYDTAAESWDNCAPLAVGRGGLGLAALGGHLYAIGGGGWTSYLGFSERYSPGSEPWRAVETPLIGQWRGPGVVAFDTSIYAIGGLGTDYLSLNQMYEALPFRTFIPISQQ